MTYLAADNFLSFDSFRLDLAAAHTVIVGPNSSGKTNVTRLIELPYRILQAYELGDEDTDLLRSFAESRHMGRRRAIRVEVGVALTEDDETDLITAFMRAALLGWLTMRQQASPADVLAIESWLHAEVVWDRLSHLATFSIIAEHDGREDSRWTLSIAFKYSGSPWRWWLGGVHFQGTITPEGPPLFGGMSPADAAQRFGVSAANSAVIPVGSFGFDAVMPGSDGVVALPVTFQQGPPLPATLTAFRDQLLIDFSPNARTYTLGLALFAILRTSMVRSGNLGAQAGGMRWGATDAAPQRTATSDISGFLVALKNGPTDARHRYASIASEFAALSDGRTFEVGLVPVPSQGPGSVTGTPVVRVARVNSRRPYEVPLEFCGAGTQEAFLLAAVLGDPGKTCVVLDEPASNLHPTAQRHLLTRLVKRDGQVIVVTHSPYLVPFHSDQHGDLAVTRISLDKRGASVATTVPPRDIDKIAPKVIAKGNQRLPFAESAILCEGQDDVEVLRTLASRHGLDLEAGNILLVDCGGRDSLPDYIAFCAALRLRHLVISDGDGAQACIPADVPRKTRSVRRAVKRSGQIGRGFEFAKRIEEAFGLNEKNSVELYRRAREADLTQFEEVQGLIRVLIEFAGHSLGRRMRLHAMARLAPRATGSVAGARRK